MFTRQLFKQVKFPIGGFNRCKPRQLSEYARKTIKYEAKKPEAKKIIEPIKATNARPIKITEPVDKKEMVENISDAIFYTGIALGGAAAPYAIYKLNYEHSYYRKPSKSEIMKSVALWSIIGIPCGAIVGGIAGGCTAIALGFILTEFEIIAILAAGGVLLAVPTIGYIYVTEK